MEYDSRWEATVVIPTRDRPGDLRCCLAGLAHQTLPVEVVVVDDSTSDSPGVAQLVEQLEGARLIAGGGRGPAAARNAGVRAARAPVVCLTDDDCEPAPPWADSLVSALRRGAEVVAGQTRPADPGDPYAAASQALTNRLAERSRIPFAASNNLAARRELLVDLPFDERFPSAAGEDRDWCARLEKLGRRLTFEERAVVVHRQTLGLLGFARQQVRYGRGAYLFRRSRASKGLEAPSFYLDLVGNGFALGFSAGVLTVLAQALVAVGWLIELLDARRRTR